MTRQPVQDKIAAILAQQRVHRKMCQFTGSAYPGHQGGIIVEAISKGQVCLRLANSIAVCAEEWTTKPFC